MNNANISPFNENELKEVHNQIVSIIKDEGWEVNENTYRKVFNFCCDNGELDVDREVTQENEDQAVYDYFNKM